MLQLVLQLDDLKLAADVDRRGKKVVSKPPMTKQEAEVGELLQPIH